MYDINDRTAATRMVQTFLLELSYADTPIPHLVVDGVYGERTRRAVRIFQNMKGLPATGRTDFLTWTALYEAYLASRKKNGEADFFSHFEFSRTLEDFT